MLRYTSWHFYALSGTNLLTSRHSASSLFSTIFVFQKSYTGNILEIGRNKFLKSYFSRKFPEIRRGDGEGPQATLTQGQRGPAPGRAPLRVRKPGSTSDAAPSPIKNPRRKKPKYLINFPETHCDPPPSSTRDREGPEALPATLPERGITTGGLLYRHAYLRSDEWVVCLGLWVHSSS
jgi:hypothetical protein